MADEYAVFERLAHNASFWRAFERDVWRSTQVMLEAAYYAGVEAAVSYAAPVLKQMPLPPAPVLDRLAMRPANLERLMVKTIREYKNPFLSAPNARIEKREESFMSALASRLPGIAGSERAYVVGLNKMRFEAWKTKYRQLQAQFPEGVPDNVVSDLNRLLNVVTGRGPIGWLTEGGPMLNALLFSPRCR